MTDDEFHDAFGDELIDALNIRARDAVPVTTAVGVSHQARRVRARRTLTAAVIAVLAVTAAGVIAARRQEPGRVRVAGPGSSTTSIPSSFKPLRTGVQDWTWVSDNQGWALARTACGTSVCVALRATTDGGRTWRSLPTPDALDVAAQYDPDAACARRACLSGVRFATSKIGWLFGPSLFRTSDGGNTWTRESSRAVLDVEAARGVAMRVTTADYECAQCGVHVDRVRLPSSEWRRFPPEFVSAQLLLQGTDSYIVSPANSAGAGDSRLWHSSGGRTTWTEINDPCALPHPGFRTESASAAPGGVLTVLCAKVGGTSASMQVSTDRGKTFGSRHALPGNFLNAEPIAAATGQTIAVAYSNQHSYGVWVSNDGGVTWHRTLALQGTLAGTGSFTPLLGWQDARTGRASFGADAIWTTRDGGRSWTEDRVVR
jgi:hypothetical protein